MLNYKVVCLSLAVTSGIVSVFCAVAVALFPVGAVKFFNTWIHGVDLTLIISAKPITLADFFIGLASVVVFSIIVGIIFTFAYNSLQKGK